MLHSKHLDDLVKQLREAIPSGLREIPNDIEKNFKAILQSAFSQLDLVTREEFDAQSGVLKRTREKVEALEKTIEHLEKQIQDNH